MAKEEARVGEIAAAAEEEVAYTRWKTKRKRTAAASGSPAAAAMCDDVLRGIFARVPARTAVASMALSRHHQALLRSPEFGALHCRLAPPLPAPHIAYIATARVKRIGGGGGGGGWNEPVSGYHGFHVAAGAGLSLSGGRTPMRALAGLTCPRMRYVGTCHGVVLLVGKARPATSCVLWNPAVADEEEEVRLPVSDDDDCAVLGFGYGPKSKTYKILLSRRRRVAPASSTRRSTVKTLPKQLLLYALASGGGGGGGGGGEQEQPRLRTVLSPEGLRLMSLDGEISGQSIYLDGTIYLLHVGKAAVLAVDVDDETVTAIDLPPGETGTGEHEHEHEDEDEEEDEDDGCKIMSTTLLLISGRPSVDVQDGRNGSRALWLLTAEYQWERQCVIDEDNHLQLYSITGVWDCGGVLFIYLCMRGQKGCGDGNGKLCMYCTSTKKMTEVDLPLKLTPPKGSRYAMCWGYKPTLVSPVSVVGGEVSISEDEEKRRTRTTDIMAALVPLNERDRRKGHKATLHTTCFMDFLVRIMQKLLPENMDEVAKMPLLKPEKEVYYPDSDREDSFEDKFMSCYNKAKRQGHLRR